MMPTVEKNEFGFYSVLNKPTEEEIEEYYSKKYYQEEKATYSHTYSEIELQFIYNKIEQRFQYLIDNQLISPNKTYSLLDVGCGEGFALKYFFNKKWDVTGLDFSDFGCETNNPDVKQFLITGNIYLNLQKITQSGQKYDIIWLDNVLEHVTDPLELLKDLKQISAPTTGILIIDVPNDFSKIQEKLIELNKVNQPFWVVLPDHLSYFNQEGLVNVCKTAGWDKKGLLADFPIDWFLLNDASNYINHKATGKQAHFSRMIVDNLMHDISIEKTNKLYEVLAEMGLGRSIIGFFLNK